MVRAFRESRQVDDELASSLSTQSRDSAFTAREKLKRLAAKKRSAKAQNTLTLKIYQNQIDSQTIVNSGKKQQQYQAEREKVYEADPGISCLEALHFGDQFHNVFSLTFKSIGRCVSSRCHPRVVMLKAREL